MVIECYFAGRTWVSVCYWGNISRWLYSHFLSRIVVSLWRTNTCAYVFVLALYTKSHSTGSSSSSSRSSTEWQNETDVWMYWNHITINNNSDSDAKNKDVAKQRQHEMCVWYITQTGWLLASLRQEFNRLLVSLAHYEKPFHRQQPCTAPIENVQSIWFNASIIPCHKNKAWRFVETTHIHIFTVCSRSLSLFERFYFVRQKKHTKLEMFTVPFAMHTQRTQSHIYISYSINIHSLLSVYVCDVYG